MDQNLESIGTVSSLAQGGISSLDLGNTKRVLFAWDATVPKPLAAALRAEVYAQLLGADLFVLAVVDVTNQATKTVQPWFHFDRAQRFLKDSLPGLDERHVLLRIGGFAELVTEVAIALDAALVVIPPAEKNPGKLANQIATTAEVMVMVARQPQFRNTVVAATDLSNPRYPVVSAADQLRDCLSAELVLIHNVVPAVFSGGLEAAWPLTGSPSAQTLSQVAVRLRNVASSCGACSEALVAVAWNTANEILRIAQERDADVVVIGTRRRTRWAQLLDKGVAVRVIRAAKQSVLIVPVKTKPAMDSVPMDGSCAMPS